MDLSRSAVGQRLKGYAVSGKGEPDVRAVAEIGSTAGCAAVQIAPVGAAQHPSIILFKEAGRQNTTIPTVNIIYIDPFIRGERTARTLHDHFYGM